MLIEGNLIHESVDDTRTYTIKDDNLIEIIVSRADSEFIKKDSRLSKSGVYMLVGNSYHSNPRVYVGETMNLRRRINQHIKKKDFWNFVIIFQLVDEQFDQSQISYLEHLIITNLIACGSVEIVENYQIPNPVYLRRDEVEYLEMIFEKIKLLLKFSGFNFFNEQNIVDIASEPEVTYGKKMINRVAKEYNRINNSKRVMYDEPDNDYYECEDEVSKTYVLSGQDYYAEVIPLHEETEFLMMPIGKIHRRTEDELKKIPEEYAKCFDKVSCNIVKDLIVNDLKIISLIVTGIESDELFKVVKNYC